MIVPKGKEIEKMREQILKVLATCPNGTLKRNIFSPANAEGHKAMYELEAEGLVVRREHKDVANMEWYDIYILKEFVDKD